MAKPNKQQENNRNKESDHVILPKQSRDFLLKIENIRDINLYLIQNRYYFRYTQKIRDRNVIKDGSMLGTVIKTGKIKHSDMYKAQAARLMENLNERNRGLVNDFLFHNCYLFSPYDKLLLGDGNSAYIGMQALRLHPLYGIPYLPASVIKGTLRNVWILERFGGSEEDAEADNGFISLFGGMGADSVQSEGKLRFFDIYPDRFEIGADVQTVHYSQYYGSQSKEPTDDQSPIPIKYACLRDSEFLLLLGCNDSEVWRCWNKDIDEMVECMLTQYGLGAKTSLGYGVGRCVKQVDDSNKNL